MAYPEISIAHWKRNAALIYDTIGIFDSKPANTQCVQWGGKLESMNKSDRRMELLYAQNYSQTSAKKTCGVAVAVMDVRRPLKSTEDVITKEAERVTTGGSGGSELVATRFLDNGAEVRDAEVNRIRYMDSAGLPSLVVAKTDHSSIPVWNLSVNEPVDGTEIPACMLKGMNKPSLYSLAVSSSSFCVIASDRQVNSVPGRVHKWTVPQNASESFPLDSRVLFGGDEDVEDVFFLDEGANVMAAVSDRGGAVVADFRSAADIVRAPSIARAHTDFTCGDAFGDHIALGCSDGTILVYDYRQLQRPLLSLHAHIRIVNRIEFNRCSAVRDCFTSCGEDGTVVLWRIQPLPGDSSSDLTDGHVIMRHIPHMSDVKDVSVCPHEEWLLASCSWSINDDFTTQFQGSIHYWRPHPFLTATEDDALKQVGAFLDKQGI